MSDLAPWTPSDALGEALHLLRMRGVFYGRTEVTDPWALEMPMIADTLSFHVVTSGDCWLEVPDGEAIALRSGGPRCGTAWSWPPAAQLPRC